MKRAQRYYQQLCFNVAEAALSESDSKVANQFGVTPKFVNYWSNKLADPLFHSGELGGPHNCKFSAEAENFVEWLLWSIVKLDDTLSNAAYARELAGLGLQVDDKWVGRVFKRWGFSSTALRHRNVLKFTQANVEYYLVYTHEILGFNEFSLKYMDESRFDSTDLLRTRGRGPRGARIDAVVQPAELKYSYSVTLLTSLDAAHGWAITEPRGGANDAFNCLQDVTAFVAAGHWQAGDILIMDNCSIHNSAETLPLLVAMLDLMHVRLVFLPKYSPECNPCELVFAQCKRFLRSHRQPGNFRDEILSAFQQVSLVNVYRYYQKCLHRFDED